MMCSTGSTETGSTGDLGGHDFDGSSSPGVVADACPPLLEVTEAFASRVVVVHHLRIGKMFVTHIAEASVDGDGKCLINNGGIKG
jgi:hypothetical protein